MAAPEASLLDRIAEMTAEPRTACWQCKGAIAGSPSDDFCSAWCQTEWHANHSDPLTDYTEPTDLPCHIANQYEQSSPETTPASEYSYTVNWGFDAAAMMRSFRVMEESFLAAGRAFNVASSSLSGFAAWLTIDETAAWGSVGTLTVGHPVVSVPADNDPLGDIKMHVTPTFAMTADMHHVPTPLAADPDVAEGAAVVIAGQRYVVEAVAWVARPTKTLTLAPTAGPTRTPWERQ